MEAVTLVGRQHARGAQQLMLALSGEERGEPGSQGWREVYYASTKGLGNGVYRGGACQFLEPHRRLPASHPCSRDSQARLPRRWEYCIAIQCCRGEGRWAWACGKASPRRGQPTQGEAGLVALEPADQAPLLLCESSGSGDNGGVLGPVLSRLGRPCWGHFCRFQAV